MVWKEGAKVASVSTERVWRLASRQWLASRQKVSMEAMASIKVTLAWWQQLASRQKVSIESKVSVAAQIKQPAAPLHSSKKINACCFTSWFCRHPTHKPRQSPICSRPSPFTLGLCQSFFFTPINLTAKFSSFIQRASSKLTTELTC